MSDRAYKPANPDLAFEAVLQATAIVRRAEASSVRQSAGVVDNTARAGACGCRGVDRVDGLHESFCPAARSAASSSLEESTLKNTEYLSGAPHYRCTLKDFGDGKVVCTGVFLEKGWSGRKVSSESCPVEIVRELPEFFTAERSEYARRRAKRTLREKVWMLRADRMLTLTKRGKFASTDDAWAAWKAFSRLARKLWGERWQFVVVPEAHKEGGYHLHIALNGYYDVGMVRRLWSRALGGTGRESGANTLGNVDFTQRVSSARSRTRIANYLAKYLGKNTGAVLRNRRALASSRGIAAPRVVRWNQAIHLSASAIGIAQRQIRELVDARLEGLGWWEFSCGGFHGFVISPLD